MSKGHLNLKQYVQLVKSIAQLHESQVKKLLYDKFKCLFRPRNGTWLPMGRQIATFVYVFPPRHKENALGKQTNAHLRVVIMTFERLMIFEDQIVSHFCMNFFFIFDNLILELIMQKDFDQNLRFSKIHKKINIES